ncbi:MAG: hypothetical protein GFH27_549305n67 [Chloroflexi bacterium AL-W]|nr:hypothetical protein [Chloroflexi bacterium AL-N1]NOK69313.1 hypothetical protein [Chloroflexi bacterium AL-N10]NOK76374.1 hypothetical protein [Chloroflexi bacterium AL-N5]NOK83491.1 hypothetical protein [Chloroflexi bacterium AL-W]NOK91151.1 hypothetical protein [Chloroflexi bacterium AL-N15]
MAQQSATQPTLIYERGFVQALEVAAASLFIFGGIALGRAAYVFVGRRMDWFSGTNDQALLVGCTLIILAVMTFLMRLLIDQVVKQREQNAELLRYLQEQRIADETRWINLQQQLHQLDVSVKRKNE